MSVTRAVARLTGETTTTYGVLFQIHGDRNYDCNRGTVLDVCELIIKTCLRPRVAAAFEKNLLTFTFNFEQVLCSLE